ncbi:hypothetical protein Tco_1459065 [Tanacetum coccineum]
MIRSVLKKLFEDGVVKLNNIAASKIKSDRDGEIREVYEKAFRMENPVRLVDEMSELQLYLPRPVFTHGQLYATLSRVKSKRGLKVVVCDEEDNVLKTTTNVVYKEVLHGL